MGLFIKINDNVIIHKNEISWIDTKRFENLIIVVHYKNRNSAIVTGLRAIDVIMATAPSAFEGRRFSWAKKRWILHNLIGHPLMQVLAFFKKYELAMWVHDVTVPRPDGKQSRKGVGT